MNQDTDGREMVSIHKVLSGGMFYVMKSERQKGKEWDIQPLLPFPSYPVKVKNKATFGLIQLRFRKFMVESESLGFK